MEAICLQLCVLDEHWCKLLGKKRGIHPLGTTGITTFFWRENMGWTGDKGHLGSKVFCYYEWLKWISLR